MQRRVKQPRAARRGERPVTTEGRLPRAGGAAAHRPTPGGTNYKFESLGREVFAEDGV